jgi:hypothetical protein
MKLLKLILLSVPFLITDIVLAQHGHNGHEMHSAEVDTMTMGNMSMSDVSLSMSRIGSGTGWLPDVAPRYGYMIHTDEWIYMIHGNVFLSYNNQDVGDEGTRGHEKFYSTNWIMGMAETGIGKNGLLRFNLMASFEPLTVGGAGYPLLFQSGESWQGEPLVDHQHPHDLISELSVSYTHTFSDDFDVFAYLGYPGEPALGPVAFMHRPSGIYNPNTTLGHHWQDATHVTFGVATLGFGYKDFKFDASIFTGTEPNEDRYGFDELRFNSYSARISYNLSDNWALQVSQGWLHDVHAIGEREDLIRTTASAIYAGSLGDDLFLNAAAVWGHNNPTRGHHMLSSHSFLLESALTLDNTTLYGRFEFVEKSTGDLLLSEVVFGHQLFGVNAITLGLQQKLFKALNTNVSLGVQSRLFITLDGLEDVYGDNPWGLQFYLRIYPGRMMH